MTPIEEQEIMDKTSLRHIAVWHSFHVEALVTMVLNHAVTDTGNQPDDGIKLTACSLQPTCLQGTYKDVIRLKPNI